MLPNEIPKDPESYGYGVINKELMYKRPDSEKLVKTEDRKKVEIEIYER